MPSVVGVGIGIPFGGLSNKFLVAVFAAEKCAVDGDISLWYAPPDSYASRSSFGPFINHDMSGGVPTVGQSVGWIKDRKVSV